MLGGGPEGTDCFCLVYLVCSPRFFLMISEVTVAATQAPWLRVVRQGISAASLELTLVQEQLLLPRRKISLLDSAVSPGTRDEDTFLPLA